MFRLTEYMQQLVNPTPVRLRNPDRAVKPVVIWNLTRRCNLKCRHCYTVSADVDFPGELSQEHAFDTLEDLGRIAGAPLRPLAGRLRWRLGGLTRLHRVGRGRRFVVRDARDENLVTIGGSKDPKIGEMKS